MSNQNSWFNQHWPDLLKIATAIFVVFYVAVFAGVWEDRNYSNNFWPGFFKWTRIAIGVALGIGWLILWLGNRKR